jgi:hypothetical protein
VKTTALTTLRKLAVLTHLTIPTILWTEGIKYYSQASCLVRPHESLSLYASNRIEHLRKNSKTFTKRLKFLWFLNLVFFIVLLYYFSFFLSFFLFSLSFISFSFFLFYFYYSCVINFTISILLSLFLHSSLSLLFLCYNPLFSLPTTLSASSHPLFPPSSPPPPILPNLPPYCPFLLHTHNLLTSLLYQLYTTPAPCNP